MDKKTPVALTLAAALAGPLAGCGDPEAAYARKQEAEAQAMRARADKPDLSRRKDAFFAGVKERKFIIHDASGHLIDSAATIDLAETRTRGQYWSTYQIYDGGTGYHLCDIIIDDITAAGMFHAMRNRQPVAPESARFAESPNYCNPGGVFLTEYEVRPEAIRAHVQAQIVMEQENGTYAGAGLNSGSPPPTQTVTSPEGKEHTWVVPVAAAVVARGAVQRGQRLRAEAASRADHRSRVDFDRDSSHRHRHRHRR